MPIASFSGPYTAIRPLTPKTGRSAAGSYVWLQMSIQTQLPQKEWCWAAVAASVASFASNGDEAWTPCMVATESFKSRGLNCCTSPHACDKMNDLGQVLPLLKIDFDLKRRALRFDEIVSSIKSSMLPICCYVGGGEILGHYVAIDGYDESTKDISIKDPLYESRIWPYEQFCKNYQTARWDSSFVIKRKARW